MIKCNLCLKNNANQTGSHIVPFFLFKKVDNLGNSKGRDKELGFVIGSMETRSYFGRGILPEKLEVIYSNLDKVKIND